ncbi:MAG TPA: nitroreductase family protein [Kiritimatiellia bacterium]|nr:nitroreductase family protein [Kiritimatiellia bacterium]
MKNLLRQLIPLRIRRCLRSPLILPGSYRSRLDRYEQIALGGVEHSSDSQLAQLRQYAHELDKGLHRKDWEPGHGEAVYQKARCLYGQLAGNAASPDGVFRWIQDILSEHEQRQHQPPDQVTPLAAEHEPFRLDPDAMAKAIAARVSSRWFQSRTIPETVLNQIVEAAAQAPSSCNRQTLQIFASLDPARTIEILKCFKGFTGFSPFIPCAMVFCADLRPYLFPNELFIPTLDTALAVENALLMASAHGLNATLLTWGSRNTEEDRRLRRILGIPDHIEIVVGAACGYPEKNAIRPARKSVADTLWLS